MKKKMFITIEFILAVLVILLAFVMLQEKNEKDRCKISVIIQNPDDPQWAAFKYGLEMAAEDYDVEMFVVSTDSTITAEEEKKLIKNEIDHGADAVILQPHTGQNTEKALRKIKKNTPMMLVESTASKDRKASRIPTIEPDQYAMGQLAAEELLKDYNGKLSGKTVGIFAETKESEAMTNRIRGFKDALKGTGAEIVWSVSGYDREDGEELLEAQIKVDFVIGLDNNSLCVAGKCAAANNLHGAVVYGIGTSTEAVYYLDTGVVECLVVPDEFNVGYQSVEEIAENAGKPLREMKGHTVSHKAIRREALFLEENQKFLFAMSQ